LETEREKERGKKYSGRVGENEKSWKNVKLFTVGKEKEHRFVRRFPGFALSSFW
jgi:hypothetical protein